MIKVAIVYFSYDGQTKRIAEEMAARFKHVLGRDGKALVIPVTARTTAFPAEADIVVVGAPVHVGRFPRRLEGWVRKNLPNLQRRKAAFFSVSMNAADARPECRAIDQQLIRAFVKRTGWEPARVAIFAGALMFLKYNWLIRMIMKRISAAANGPTDTSRNYEFTDWSQVNDFVAKLIREQAITVTPHIA